VDEGDCFRLKNAFTGISAPRQIQATLHTVRGYLAPPKHSEEILEFAMQRSETQTLMTCFDGSRRCGTCQEFFSWEIYDLILFAFVWRPPCLFGIFCFTLDVL
jgi:hypothetical protein